MKKIRIIALLSCSGIAMLNKGFSQVVKPYDKKAALSINKYIKDHSALPIKPGKTLSFTTNEAGRMHCDVSPDGKTLVVTILGDLFLLPSEGGTAIQITRGVSVNTSPKWSPDGKYIAYISDATGSPHTNIRSIDGTFHKVLNDQLPIPEHDTLVQAYYWKKNLGPNEWEPHWLPDGRSLVSNGQVFDLAGTIINLPGNVYHYANRPILGFSSDRRYIFTTDNINTDKDINIFTIDQKSCDTINVRALSMQSEGFACNYRISPNGKYLSFIRMAGINSNLFLTDLTTGESRLIKSFVDEDSITKRKNEGYSFSPDSKYLYISFAKKLHRLSIEGPEDKIIPFTAKVEVDMAASKLHQFKVNANELKTVRLIRHAQRTKDGKKLVFSALKKIYVMDVASGKIKSIAEGPGVLYQPKLSSDGKYVAYISHTDADNIGRIQIRDIEGNEPVRTIARHNGSYVSICWSRDGNSIATLLSADKSTSGLYVINTSSKISIFIKSDTDVWTKKIESFSENGNKIFYSLKGGELFSIENKAAGKEKCLVKMVPGNNKSYDWEKVRFSISPDAKHLIFTNNEDLFLIPFIAMGEPIIPNSSGSHVIRFVVGAIDPQWEQDGKAISWCYGNKFYSTTLDQVLTSVEKGKIVKDSLGILPYKIIDTRPKTNSVVINLKYPTYHAKGEFALINAKIITMEGNQVIEPGTIWVKDGIIKAVGKSNDILVPKHVRMINVQGKSIIPGMLDLHLHTNKDLEIRYEGMLKQNAYFSNGVTTGLDPSSTQEKLAYYDIVEAGLVKEPRFYSVGATVGPNYGVPIPNLEEARNEVRKRAELGVIAIKQYKQQTRLQQQWLLMACNEYGVNMTNEGANIAEEFLGQVKNGTPKIEHMGFGWNAGLIKDVGLLLKASGVYTTTTNQKNSGGDNYWIRRFPDTSTWLKKFDQKTFAKYQQMSTEFNRKTDDDSSRYIQIEYYTYRIFREGARVSLGSHGDYPGLDLHYEMWGKVRGGYTNFEALKAATIVGAEGLGLDKYLGSIKAGKIADLIIINKDPLTDIHFNNDIIYVMKNGVMYDPKTLNVVSVNDAQTILSNSENSKQRKVQNSTESMR